MAVRKKAKKVVVRTETITNAQTGEKFPVSVHYGPNAKLPDKQVAVRLSAGDRALLSRLQEHLGVRSQSEIIRMALRALKRAQTNGKK